MSRLMSSQLVDNEDAAALPQNWSLIGDCFWRDSVMPTRSEADVALRG